MQRIDGHDLEAILGALDELAPAGVGKPQMIIADTVKGRGVRMMEGNLDWHVGNLVGRDYDAVVAELQRGLAPVGERGGGCDDERRGHPTTRKRRSVPRRQRAGRLTESESVKGTPASRLPAFVLGEELADLADRDPRIVVLTADLASANRTVEFEAAIPRATSTSASPRRTW